MPPTIMYLRNILITFSWRSLPRGSLFSNPDLIRGTVTSSPMAQQNSSKSMGSIRILSSSEGMMMSFTLSWIDIRRPVSM